MRLSLVAFYLVSVAPVFGAGPVDFNRDIRPILSDNCFYCHGNDANHRKAKLRLDVRDDALAKEAFVPSKPDESALVERIFTEDEDDLMPPTGFEQEADGKAEGNAEAMGGAGRALPAALVL